MQKSVRFERQTMLRSGMAPLGRKLRIGERSLTLMPPRYVADSRCATCRTAAEIGTRQLDDELLLCVRAMNAVDRAVADGRRAAGEQAEHLDWDQLFELLREP